MNKNDNNRSVYHSKVGIIFRWIAFVPFSILIWFITYFAIFYFLLVSMNFVTMSEFRYNIIAFINATIFSPFIASIISIFSVAYVAPQKKRLCVNIVSVIFGSILLVMCLIGIIMIIYTGEYHLLNELDKTDVELWCTHISSFAGIIVGNIYNK